MAKGRIVHISDIHIGHSPDRSIVASELCAKINQLEVSHVIVTGDITEHGRVSEYEEFLNIVARLNPEIKVIMLPGNHDYRKDRVANRIMTGSRIDLIQEEGLSIIRVNTTGWHNRFLIASHGAMDFGMIGEIDEVLGKLPKDDLIVVTLHHHILPLPLEGFLDRLSSWLWLPFTAELYLGNLLLNTLKERCDLVLHGHKHNPAEIIIPMTNRSLRICNAGSSTLMNAFRVFDYENGKIINEPTWIKNN